jgi:Fe-S oxidoreductase
MPFEKPFYEVSDSIVDSGGRDLLSCYQCGTCTSVCPWRLTASMEIRRMMHLGQLGLSGYEETTLWRCVTCRRCVDMCPRGVGITDVVAAARSLMVDIGSVPRSVGTALGSLKASRNPWQGEQKQREAWMKKAGLQTFDAGCSLLLFPCCTSVFDPLSQKGSLAFAALLEKAGVRAGLPSSGGICCGDLAVRAGAGGLFEELRKELEQEFNALHHPPTVVHSPHCMVTLRESAHMAAAFTHYTQVLWSLLEQGRLKVSVKIEEKVTYQDPCYLGRISGVYEEPRNILKALAGDGFVEMERNRSTAVCCGGGGGGAFSEVDRSERLGVLRAKEAAESGARILATACPLCTVMLSDGILAAGLENELRVMDIASLLLDSI